MAFPLPVAAVGPDYGVGDSYYPVWHPSLLEPGTVVVVAPNYGELGSQAKYAGQSGRFGRTAKVYPISWDPGPDPAFDPRLPVWNNLPRGAIYNAHIPSGKQLANTNASVVRYNVQKTSRFVPPAMASLTEVN